MGGRTGGQLEYPTSVVADLYGNFYIADLQHSRVRKVSSGGIITTFAWDGAYAGNSDVGDGGPATIATVSDPSALAIDPLGRLIIAEEWILGRVRLVALDGVITSIAGNGSGYSGDGGPAVMPNFTTQAGSPAMPQETCTLSIHGTGAFGESLPVELLLRSREPAVTVSPVMGYPLSRQT